MSLVEGIPQTIKEIGSARAGKAAARGNYGPTLARIGQGIADLPNELQQNRAADQREQLGNLQLADAQRKQAASQALDQAMTSALKPDGTFDSSLLAQHLAGTPAAGQYPEIQEHLNAWQESELRLKKANEDAKGAEADAMGRLAKGASAAGDPSDQAGVLLAGLASRVKQGLMRQEDATDVISEFMGDDHQPDPDKVKATIARMLQESNAQRELGVKEAHANYEQSNADSLADERKANAAARTANAAAATQKATEESATKARASFASQLASATTKERYAQIYRGVPEDLRNYFHTPEEWNKDVSPEVARLAAMTPAEQATYLERKNTAAGVSDRSDRDYNLRKQAQDWRQAHPPASATSDTSPYSTENTRGYNEFQQNWAARYPKPTSAYDLTTGNPSVQPPPPPSIEKWSVMTPQERQRVLEDPKARIDDATMTARSTKGPTPAQPGTIKPKTTPTKRPGPNGQFYVTGPDGQSYLAKDEATADQAIKLWQQAK